MKKCDCTISISIFEKPGGMQGVWWKVIKMTTWTKKIWLKEGVYKAALEQQHQQIQWCSRYGFYSKQRY